MSAHARVTMICFAFMATSTLTAPAAAGPPLDDDTPPLWTTAAASDAATTSTCAERAGAPALPAPPGLLDAPRGEASPRPRTFAERHEWEERGGLIGLASGAVLGLGGVVALGMSLPPGQGDPTAQGVALGMLAFFAAGAGAYGGAFIGSGIGIVVDAANAPPPPAVTTHVASR